MTTQLGHLERVDHRTVWPDEARDFTPWLANNLDVLGKTLAINLELEATEKMVGRFKADIIGKEVSTGDIVLIENQLEKTDHSHLGQVLTYAAGLQAVTVVWIAAKVQDEHRATLDWLNEITDEGFRFFGLEIELWRIKNSFPAPRFNIISKPNNWSRVTRKAARSVDSADLTETKSLQLTYWDALHKVLKTAGGPISGNRKAQPQSWMSWGVGRGSFSVNAVTKIKDGRIQAELYISGVNAKAFFGLLKQQKDEIDQELGPPLEWEELPMGQDSRISSSLENADPKDPSDWPRQHEWLATRLNDMHRVFAPRVKTLDLKDWEPENA